MRSEYAQIVVLCRSFWLQSMNTRPLRSAFAMFTVVRFGSRATSIWPSASAKFFVSSSVTVRRRSAGPRCAGPCRPRSSRPRRARARRAARGARSRPGSSRARRPARPGSRSSTTAHGRFTSGSRHWFVWSSSAARFASHTSVGRSSTTQLRCPPLGSSGSDACTHVGWCGGQRFSKNRSPCRAVGRAHQRGRPPGQVGQHHRGDPAVVVDDVGFAEARRRVEQLVEVRERRARGRRPRRSPSTG